jgi:hypothetical protein
MAGAANWMVIEGPIKGETRLKYGKNKDGTQGQLTCNLGFPVDTTEQAGMEHKDLWMRTVSFGAFAEIISKLPAGFNLHVEGEVTGNRWIDQTTHLEKMTMQLIVRKAGEAQGIGKETKWFVLPRRTKEAEKGQGVVKVLAEHKELVSKLTPDVLAEARRYLAEHEQHDRQGDLGDIQGSETHSGANEATGPGVASSEGASPEGAGPGAAG